MWRGKHRLGYGNRSSSVRFGGAETGGGGKGAGGRKAHESELEGLVCATPFPSPATTHAVGEPMFPVLEGVHGQYLFLVHSPQGSLEAERYLPTPPRLVLFQTGDAILNETLDDHLVIQARLLA